MRTLTTEERDILGACVNACGHPSQRLSAGAELAVLLRLEGRGLISRCWCDGFVAPHPKVTPLGRTALECARALEMTP
ncbi:MAG: hypothetical protein WBY94_03175 [Polyangiaceae bacterium]